MLLGSQLFEHVFYNISPTLNHDSFSFAVVLLRVLR